MWFVAAGPHNTYPPHCGRNVIRACTASRLPVRLRKTAGNNGEGFRQRGRSSGPPKVTSAEVRQCHPLTLDTLRRIFGPYVAEPPVPVRSLRRPAATPQKCMCWSVGPPIGCGDGGAVAAAQDVQRGEEHACGSPACACGSKLAVQGGRGWNAGTSAPAASTRRPERMVMTLRPSGRGPGIQVGGGVAHILGLGLM